MVPLAAQTDVATRAIVTELYEAYASRDGQRIAALIHDDIDWQVYGPIQVFPFGGPRRGKEQVLEVFASIARDYELQSYKPEVVIVEGDRAAVMSSAAFLQRTTNRTLRLRLVNLLRMHDGKIIEFREFTDTFDAVEQALGRWLQL